MSEYQYYEFLAIDSPLNADEMAELRDVSTRAEITPTGFRNEYNYSDLKADAGELLERYFDLHVYVANWGTRRLAMRLPSELGAVEDFAPYVQGEGADVRLAGEHIIIELWSETEEREDWVDGGGWMGALAGVRAKLLGGDLRPLYIIWLHSVGFDYFDAEDEDAAEVEEPPVPAGMTDLPPCLESMAEFLRIDPVLLKAAAEASHPGQLKQRDIAPWIAALDDGEKNSLLLRVVRGEHARVTASLVSRFRAETCRDNRSPAPRRRTVPELLARVEELEEAERRRNALAAAEAKRKREAAEASAKLKRLSALAERKPAAWRDVQQLVDAKKAKSYDHAVRLLVDLRDLAVREGDAAAFSRRLNVLRELNASKRAFQRRLDQAGLR